MAAPAVILVPSNDSPVSSHSSHSREPSSSEAPEADERNSSETTIFTIYSMYSEKRATWRGSSQRQSADNLHQQGDSSNGRSRDSDSFFLRPGTGTGTPSGRNSPSNRTSNGSAYRNSFEYAGNARASQSVPNAITASPLNRPTSQESSELPYLHSSVDSTSSMKLQSSPFLPVPTTSVPGSNQSSSSRPRHAVSSWSKYVDRTLTDEIQPDLSLHRFSRLQYSTDVSDSERAGPSQVLPPRPPRKSPPLEHRKINSGDTAADGDASVTHEGYFTAPQTIDSHSNSRMQLPLPEVIVADELARALTPPPPPPPPKVRSPTNSLTKALPARPKTAPGPSYSPASPPLRRKSSAFSLPKPSTSQSPRPSESSRSSGPSVGEDPESYFVRNVYARLDVTGVRGDGYEEGIERTRAKLGHDRLSVQLAALAGESGGEESKEIEMLRKLDRYVYFNTPQSYSDRKLALAR